MTSVIRTIETVKSTIDDVVKYIIEDEQFGKNEVSVIYKADKIIFCVPTQTNCKMGCVFCHLTGTTRPAKNLTPEWLDAVVDHLIDAENIQDRTNDLLISFMGVGEPLINTDLLIQSFERLTNKHKNIRFGVSTMMPSATSMNEITQFLAKNTQYRVKMHLSVHGIHSRDKIIKSKVDILEAIHLMQEFHKVTQQPIEYHYTLVAGINDRDSELTNFNNLIHGDESIVKFLTLSETNGCQVTTQSEDHIRSLFPVHVVEFYNPPGRDVGSSCGMFNRELYNA